jgi:FkbM family methyltransferase
MRRSQAALAALARTAGFARSLLIYYGQPWRITAMRRHYRALIAPGDLVFDVGAHVGDRIAAFRRLGARVVAVEPQPPLTFTLNLLYGRCRDVKIAPVAIGRSAGTIELMVNVDNPTISTASSAFVHAAHDAPGWREQQWDKSITVPMTTLDALIAEHGRPAFIKIDVEGFEAEALAGLTQPVAALSFEFTTIQRDVARACIERCVALGYTRFNAAVGESQELGAWRSAAEITAWVDGLPHAANSGDIYARLA